MIKRILFALLTMFLYAQVGNTQTEEPLTGAPLAREPLARKQLTEEPLSEEVVGPAMPPPPETRIQSDSQPAPITMDEYTGLLERLDMMEEDIEHLLGQQDKLKEKSVLDRLNWSGSYRFNANFYHLTDYTHDDYPSHLEIKMGPNGPVMTPNGTPETVVVPAGRRDRKEWLAPSWTHHLKLAMTYDFGETLRFYSQLGVYKYFNEALNSAGMVDHGSNAYPRDNSFRLERVYFDWFVADWLAISIGRIASPDGPPTELKENAERRSGWGVQMVNATIDTVMATIYLRDKMYLRMFYSPFGTHMNFAVNNEITLLDDQGLDILHSWGALYEMAIPKMEDSIFQLGFLHIPKFSPRNMKVASPGSDILVSPGEPTGQDLGMYLQASSLLMLKNLFNSGLDIFGSYSLTVLNPTEHRMVYDFPMELNIVDPTTGEVVQNEQTGAPITAASVHREEFGLASYEEGAGSKNFGHAVYAGMRYTLPVSEKYPTRIGGEFNWGTKYHIPWSHPNDQLVNKLGNKGLAVEGYIIQQMVPEHLFCRIGYMELQRNYTGQFIGPTSDANQRIRNIYFVVDLSW